MDKELDQGVHYVPQIRTSMRDSILRAIQIAKALKDAGLHSYVHLDYNGHTAWVNEKSDIDQDVKDLIDHIEKWNAKYRGF